MNDTRIVKLADRGETKRLRWLAKATSKEESRPVLQTIHVNNGTSVATDGYRLFATTTPVALAQDALVAESSMTRIESLPATSTIAQVSSVHEGRYPEYTAILPKRDPEFSISLDANLLREALEACRKDDKLVTLRFWDDTSAFEVLGKMDGQPIYALIMPMRPDGDTRHTWRPV